jgi:hypothetical protein
MPADVMFACVSMTFGVVFLVVYIVGMYWASFGA